MATTGPRHAAPPTQKRRMPIEDGWPSRVSSRARPSRPRPLAWAALMVALLGGVIVLIALGSTEPRGADMTASGSAPRPVAPPAVPRGPSAVPVVPSPAVTATAQLPAGRGYAVSGDGTWHVVPGGTERRGHGREITYAVEVEDGAVAPEGDAAFAAAVDSTLADPRSWIGSGRTALRRVDGGEPDFRVSLTSQTTARDVCGFDIPYDASCWISSLDRVVISAPRWARGAAAFEGNLALYRQYAINHEVGHALDVDHEYCLRAGDLAPVMMQQTFGVSNNYLAQLTEAGTDGVAIPRDGAVCRPNAWPYPQGPPRAP